MIPHGVEVFVGLDPIDLRWGFESLSGVVAERLGRDVRCGALFLFFGRRRDALKLVFFDGSGLWVFYKRLDSGGFRVPEPPRPGAMAIEIEARMLDDLLDGVDIDQRTARPKRRRIH